MHALTVATKTLVVGPEFDEGLLNDLRKLLKSMGAEPRDADWAMGGSQELDSMKFDLRGQQILVESETYVGLSVTGPAALVDQIAASLDAGSGSRST